MAASDLQPRRRRQGRAAGQRREAAKKSERAKLVGAALAKLCLEKGISKVVFDRGGYKYHGRVSAVAAGAREGGLDF